MFITRKGGLRFVPRTTVAAFDFQLGDFTQDGAWHSKSWSSIVPKTAKLVTLKMIYTAPAVGRAFLLRTPGVTYDYNSYGAIALAAGAQFELNFIMPVTNSQTFEYYLSAAGSTVAILIVQGWFV